ncbi:unnamed protein product [Trifolium pratense]|uniref:Uncharacterized protein n=1 Tax=Trifolium pratense TaxID=57577 RepID=A0ACB0JRD1_TRIPR|nr:unnamed protein product [Trifolium pratense]
MVEVGDLDASITIYLCNPHGYICHEPLPKPFRRQITIDFHYSKTIIKQFMKTYISVEDPKNKKWGH